jgi:transposase-like protein
MKKALPKYYVYEIWDPIDGVCRYVGKGHGKRVADQSDPRKVGNPRLKALISDRKDQGIAIEPMIVYRHNIEAEVLRREMALIAKYGRIGVDPDGTLFNVTAGGQGITGRGKPVTIMGIVYSTITEAALAYDMRSDTLQRRLSSGWTPEQAVGLEPKVVTSKLAKPVVVDGVTYPSQTAACKAYGVDLTAVIGRLKRGWSAEEAYGAKPRNPIHFRPIVVDGISFSSVKEAAERFGVRSDTALARLKRGWNPEEAFGISRRQLGNRRFSESEVIDMRERAARGQNMADIAKYYGADPSSVSMICRGKTYPYFGGEITETEPRRRPLDSRIVLSIRKAHKAGVSVRDLAERFGLDSSSVSRICRGEAYREVGGPVSPGQRRLTPEERQAILHEKKQGRSLAEIAATWKIHLETVRQICARAEERNKRP